MHGPPASIVATPFRTQPSLQVPLPKIQHRSVQMPSRCGTSDTMPLHGVHHQFEQLVRFDQFLDEQIRVLDMHIVVVRAVDEHELAVKVFRILHQRYAFISFLILLFCFHHCFSPLRIVQTEVGDTRARNACLELL